MIGFTQLLTHMLFVCRVNQFNDDDDESYDDEEEEDDLYGYEDEAATNSGTVFGSTTGVEGPKNGPCKLIHSLY